MKELKKLIERSYALKEGELKLSLYLRENHYGLKKHKYNLVVETTKYNDCESIISKIVEMLDEYFRGLDKKALSVPVQRKVVCHPDGIYFDLFYNTEKVNMNLIDKQGEYVKSSTEKEYSDILKKINNIRSESDSYDVSSISREYLKAYRNWKIARLTYFKSNSPEHAYNRYNTIKSTYQYDDILMTCEFDFGYDEDDYEQCEIDGYCKGYYRTNITFPEYFISDENGTIENIWEFENGKLYYLLLEELGWIGYATGEIEASALKDFRHKNDSKDDN